MLNTMRLRHFKAWQDTGPIEFAPLTLIFGPNSAGKSSLGHWLLALKQTVQSSDRHRALHLGDPHSLVELGMFADCLHRHDVTKSLAFDMQWQLDPALAVSDPLSGKTYRGNGMAVGVRWLANAQQQPQVQNLRYQLFQDQYESLGASLEQVTNKGSSQYDMHATGYGLMRNPGRAWPLDAPDKFYRVSELSLSRFQNARFMSDFALALENMLGHFYYLGPLREAAQRIYAWSGDAPEHVGMRGEYAVAAILAATAQGRSLGIKPRAKAVSFAEHIAACMKQLGVIHEFCVRPLAAGRKEYEVLVKISEAASEVKLTDVGFGVSQVLPALVQAHYCPPQSTVWMEQPEIHLHPQVQANLADVLIAATRARENGKPRGVQLIVESHSEHLLNRLQRRVAERVVSPSEVAVYFCSHQHGQAKMERLALDADGEIANWPKDFFGNEMADIAGRTLAAMAHRTKART